MSDAAPPHVDAAELLRMIDEAPGDRITLLKDQFRVLAREIAAGNAARVMMEQAQRIERAIDELIVGAPRRVS